MVIFTKKFRTLDPHLPIVWDKVLKKTLFSFTPSLISTEGALRLPTTYDNHPMPSVHPSIPTYSCEEDLSIESNLINLINLPMTTNDYQ